MTEFKLTIEAPALAEAFNALAVALQSRPVVAFPAEGTATPTASKKSSKAAPAAQTTAPVQAAPVQAAPVTPIANGAPVATTPAQVQYPAAQIPVAQSVTAAPVMPVASNPVAQPPMAASAVPAAQPVPSAVVPSNAAAKPLTLEALANAGAGLLEKGMMGQLMGLLNQFGVQAVTMLRPEQYGAFADGLRALGAAI